MRLRAFSSWRQTAVFTLVSLAIATVCVMVVVLVIAAPIALLYQGVQAVTQFSLGLIWVKRDTNLRGSPPLKNG
jgi:hypothetical protein